MSTTERETSIEAMPRIIDPRVERGAALLDEKMPGWHDRINLDTLRLSGVRDCVAGQLGGGDYSRTLKRLDLCTGADVGMYTEAGRDDYAAMEQDWRLAILSRRDA